MRTTSTTTWFLVVLGIALGSAGTAHGQELGMGPTYGSNSSSSMPGGPGLQTWASFDVIPALRLRISAVREWGRETEHRRFCGFVAPEGGATGECVDEDVRRFTTITSGDLAAVLLTPERLGARLGIGVSYGAHRLDVGQEGLETGRFLAPAEGRRRTRTGPGWLLLVEQGLDAAPTALRASLEAYQVDLGACVMDAWSLCGEAWFGRLTIGLGYQVF